MVGLVERPVLAGAAALLVGTWLTSLSVPPEGIGCGVHSHVALGSNRSRPASNHVQELWYPLLRSPVAHPWSWLCIVKTTLRTGCTSVGAKAPRNLSKPCVSSSLLRGAGGILSSVVYRAVGGCLKPTGGVLI